MNRYLVLIFLIILFSGCSTTLVEFENTSSVEFSDSEKSLFLGNKSCTIFNFAEATMKDSISIVDSAFIDLSEDYKIDLKIISCDVLPADLVNSIQKNLVFEKEINEDDIKELYKFTDTDFILINYINKKESELIVAVEYTNTWWSWMQSQVYIYDKNLQFKQLDLLQTRREILSYSIGSFIDYYLISFLLHYYIEPFFPNNLSEYKIPDNKLSNIFEVYEDVLQIDFLKKANKKYPKKIYHLVNDKELEENNLYYEYLIEIGFIEEIEKYYVVDRNADKRHAIFYNTEFMFKYLDKIFTSN